MTPSVPAPTEEDAFNSIVQFLQTSRPGEDGLYGYDVYIPTVMEYYLRHSHSVGGSGARNHFERMSSVFYAAAWDLCRRGILRPGVKKFGAQATGSGSAGDGYSVTPFGRTWMKEPGGNFQYVPTEPGRFAKMLDAFTPRFGLAFKERGQEAVRCYGAHAYLACCAMCGAATESIFLAVAIEKEGDETKVLKEYLSGGGRGRVEKKILGQQPPAIAEEFRAYTMLLKYWRDAAAHGNASGIEDNQAYTSLAMLLRFAHFVADRWDDLVK